MCVCVYVQQRCGLKGREKEQMWKELLKVLRPGQTGRSKYTIPEEDDFDPDTYGKPIEQTIKGKACHSRDTSTQIKIIIIGSFMCNNTVPNNFWIIEIHIMS